MEYVHTLRLEEAKQMLETRELFLEAVTDEVGYEDASFFERLVRRKVRLITAQYCKRFGNLRKVLEGPGLETGSYKEWRVTIIFFHTLDQLNGLDPLQFKRMFVIPSVL
jgi:AraC-like DNA-binding protein